MLAEITPAPPGPVRLSLRRYIAAYPPAATTIATQTQELAGELAEDLLAGVDRIADDAWRALEQITYPTVMGRRGPLTRHDYLMTRLLELVVHGDDLHRLVPVSSNPVLDEAADAVADALAVAYREAAGGQADTSDRLAWIRLAAGRVPSDDVHLPLL